MKVREFKSIPFTRDREYFKDGYASWVLKHRNKTYYVNAVYGKQALENNETENDCFNGIKSFELTDSKYKTIKTFKVEKKTEIFDLGVVEQFLVRYF